MGYRKKRYYHKKTNGNNLSAVGNQLGRDNVKAKKRIQRGSFF